MKRTGVAFPGQGSQRIGMARDFYNNFAITKDRFEEASEAIQVDVAKLCFEENDDINLTKYTQPALLTVEIGMYQAIQDKYKFSGDYFAGHSLGEYTALVAAGAIPFKDAIKIVHKRGTLMQSAMSKNNESGGMAALVCDNIEDTIYRNIIEKSNVELANLNSKNQIIISGMKADIDKTAEELKVAIEGFDVIPLNVRTPFHSSFMKVIEKEFEDYLLGFSENFHQKASEQVLSNFTGTLHNATEFVSNLVKQISGSVNWISNMEVMADKCSQIYEIGPNRVLGKFFATIGTEIKSIMRVKSLEAIFA